MRQPTFVSLFAGIGGFDLGLEEAGLRGIGQVEKHPFCLAVLKRHWPDVPKHNDVITAVEWWRSEPRPDVDVVCGGFPCQDISLAKADRQGLDGDRSGLYWDALGFVVAVQPRLVLLENVEGLLSSNGGRDLALIQATLAECGYPYLEWRVLDSQYFGVPQRRVRVFLVASASDPRLGPLLLEPEGRGRDLEAISKARQKAARAATRLHDEGGGTGDPGSTSADADGVRAAAGLSGRVDHLGHTARTLTTSGARLDGDTDSFVVAPIVAATLTRGSHSEGVSTPGRHSEDDLNLVVPATGLNDPASTLTAHIGHAYSSPRGDGSDNLIFHLPTSTLQGSPSDDKTRGYRIDAEAAAGNQLVVSALTKNSAGHAGPDDNEAQANRLIVVGMGLRDAPQVARALTSSAAKGGSPAEVEPNLAVYTKSRNAHDAEDYELWNASEISRTLSQFEFSDVRTTSAVTESGVQPDGGCGCCPDDPAPDANRFGTCGNAVTTHVVRWIGMRLWDELLAQQLDV